MVSHTARNLALAVCFGLVIGGSLPELGNFTVYYILAEGHTDAHRFNVYFLALGLCGVIVFGIALYRRLFQSTVDRMVK